MLKHLLLSVLALFLLTTSAFSQGIGIAKNVQPLGREQVLTFTIESFENDTLFKIQVIDDLDAVFGAGNYTVSSPPSTTGNLVANSNYNGSTQTSLLDVNNSFLKAGQTAQITLGISIQSVTDQGLGFGLYSNQVTVTAEDKNSQPFSDLSDFGNNPDPNGNQDPGDAGEDDPTIIDLLQNPIIGIAKTTSVNGQDVTFNFFLENFGNRNIQNLSITDDLDAVFGAGNYSISSGPSIISGPNLTANTSFNGSSNTNLLNTSSFINVGITAQVQLTVTVNNVINQGNGLGVYSNQATASGQSSGGKTTSDVSDQGVNPDPNGNNSPGDPDENDPTVFVIGENPVIGVSKTATVNNGEVTFDIYLENLGDVNLTNISLRDNLKDVFGAGNFNITGLTSLTVSPGTTLNTSFDGNFDTELISGGTLAPGEVNIFRFTAENIILSDQGLGEGNYSNQATAQAYSVNGAFTSDLSDDGTDPDPNGNGNPNEAGENDATTFSVSSIDLLGLSIEYKLVSNSGQPNIELFYTLENFGNRRVSGISINQDLNAVYGAGNYVHTQNPVHVSGSLTISYNAAYNGSTNTNLLSSGSYLDPGESVVFKIGHVLINMTDQGFGLGIYQAQATVDGSNPETDPVSDVSTEGNNPDPDGNGNPDEMTPTEIDVNLLPSIGLALNSTENGNEIILDYYLENLGNVSLSEISLPINLEQFFGNGNFTITGVPTFVDDPGTLQINPAYDGTLANSALFDLGTSSLAVGETAQIRIIINLNNIENTGNGLGTYVLQNTVTAKSASSGYFEDLSDSGTDPDPDGDNNANEAGENDPDYINLAVDPIGTALNATISNGLDVTLDLYLEGFGAAPSNNLSLLLDLEETFGAGNFSISSAPAFISDPGTMMLNGSFNGSTNTELFSSGSSINNTATAQIQLTVHVNALTDLGNGMGVHQAQAIFSGSNISGLRVKDLSDSGVEPDQNNNNSAGDANEDDITQIALGSPGIGIAKIAAVSGNNVYYLYTIENIGNLPLTDVSVTNNLFSVFGFGNYSVLQQPVKISGPSTINVINAFDGTFAQTLVFGGTLLPKEKAEILFALTVNTVTNQGNGFGIYKSNANTSALSPDNQTQTDISDEGLETDPDQDGNANEAGENDASTADLNAGKSLGMALDATVSGNEVTLDIYLENFENSQISNLLLNKNLDDVFGAGNYIVKTAPALIDDPGTITLNPSFDGSADISIIQTGSTLGGISTAHIRMVIEISTVVDNGAGTGNYSCQMLLKGTAPDNSFTGDWSDSGTDPDPDGNGIPFSQGENDPTLFSVDDSSIGLAMQSSVDCDGVITLTYGIQNLGSTSLDSLSLQLDLDDLFGSGSYTIEQTPELTTEQRGLDLNEGFDGSEEKDILLPSSVSSGNGIERIVLKIKLNNPSNQLYSISSIIYATNSNNKQISDLSDNGSNPDPNGNSIANETGENDPTPFQTYALMSASITSSTNVSCFGFNNGSAVVSATGGDGNYTYSWSPLGGVLTTGTNLSAGSYTVTVADGRNCTATASVVITQPDTLIATITSSENLSCDEAGDGEIDLTVSGGTESYSYSWSNSATTQDLMGLQAGIYSVTVTDANSCTATASVEITQPDTLLATITSTKDLTCYESADGEIDLTVTGGTESYSYSWSNSATTQDLTGLAANTYSVTVTDANGCSATASVQIYQPDLLVATISSSTNLSCYKSNDGAIDLEVSGGSGHYNYSWSNSATTEDLSGLAAGTYSVTVTDDNNCTATASVEITQPDTLIATITSSKKLSCDEAGDGEIDLAVSGGTENYSYSWSNSATTQDLTGLQAGIYSVTVTDANSCTATASVEITQPDTLLATITSTKDLTCYESADGEIDLTVTGGTESYSYSWSNSATTQDLTGLSANTYSVTVTDANGCSATATVELTQPLQPILTEASHLNPTTCGGSEGSISFSTSNVPDGTFSLSYYYNNNTTSTIQVILNSGEFEIQTLSSGSYSNFVLDYGQCEVTLSGPIELQGPVFETSASNTGPYNVGDEIQLMVASGVEFSWTGPNNFYSFAQAPTISSAQEASAGTYEVIVKGANNCVDTVSTTVVVNCLPSKFKYYLVYGGPSPEVVTELTDGLSFQPEAGRLLNIFAQPNCSENPIESMKLQLSGTSEIQYREDNEPIYALYEGEGQFGGDFLSPNLYTFIATAYDQDNAQGNDLYGQEVIQFYIVSGQNTISKPVVNQTHFCNGDELIVNVNSTGTFVTGNLYQVYLSDKNGKFISPRLIGFSNDPSNISCQMPSDAESGSNYKIKVVSTAPVVNSTISESFSIIGSNLSLVSTTDDINGGTTDQRAVVSIQAENDITGNSRTDFKAGRNIQLKPGFSVESGSVFSGVIEGQCPR
ncbi:SprB repeat-containing protein [Jiulongibacter sediminis]|nr:SprB repeat-containing protein [Jiulongibacter sediminis]